MSRESHASTQDDSGESSEGIPTKIPPPIGMKYGEKFEEKRMPSLDQVTISPDDGLYYCPLSDCERPCRFETKTRLRCAYNIHSFWSMLSHPSPGTICDSGSSQLCVQSALTPQPCRKTCNVTLTAIMGALESLFAMNVKTSLLATITYWGIGEFNILCHEWIKTITRRHHQDRTPFIASLSYVRQNAAKYRLRLWNMSHVWSKCWYMDMWTQLLLFLADP